ncbi:MAG: helix-turn-helix transcriptional regulator [Clostridia bacterium]|nr:helix-turn-helix transcriptional regulator [Clostridia bacterium]
MIKTHAFNLGELPNFTVNATYSEITRAHPENVNNAHIHPECEIYVNLSGNVSFIVEGRIYPIVPGSVIISKPYEYHHCVYHSDEVHKHFWILLSLPATESGRKLFSKFLDRVPGENNLLCFEKSAEKEFFSLCSALSNKSLTVCEKYALTFRLLMMIEGANTVDKPQKSYPQELDTALKYIDKNFKSSSLSLDEIADYSGVSINTLERYFKKFITISPSSYIKKKRLAAAAELLFQQKSVSEASDFSGFSDYSHFISIFKKHFGMTPLQYKKRLEKDITSDI